MPHEPSTTPLFAAIEADFLVWRAAHPAATLTELEIELDRRMREGRAQLLSVAAETTPVPAGVCPDCGHALVAHGQRVRQVVTQGDESLILERPSLRCPACGAGLFPPG